MTTLSPPPQTRNIGSVLIGGKPVPVQAEIAWFRYFAQGIYDRVGGATGLSNTELAALIAALDAAIDALDIRVTAAEGSIVDLLADVAQIQLDVVDLQGRVAAIEAELMPKALQYDYIDATTAYRGEADPGALTSAAAWRVQRITITGDDVVIEWAAGSSAQTQIWDDRASLSYS